MASQYRRRSLMLNTIAKVAQGNPTIITDSSSRRLQKLNIYGQSSQDGTPTPENPVEIKNAEISKITICNENLLPLDIDTKIDNEGIYFYQNLGFTLKKGIRYVLSVKSIVTGLYAVPFGSTSPDDSPFKVYDGDTVEFTPTETGKYYFHAYNKSGITDEQKILWVNIGEKKPYTEHVSEQITLSEPITLRGIPVSSDGNVTIDGQQYVSDVITEKDGVIGVERNTIPFSLVVKDMNNNDDSPGWHPIEVVDKILPPNDNDTQITNTLCNIISRTIYARRDTKTVYFVKEELGKNQTELKEQHPDLSVNFIAINYQPTFEPLPEEIQAQYKALKSYYPNTVIQTGCWNEVTYSAKRGG